MALLAADPDLGHELGDEQRALARHAVIVPRIDIAPGTWSPPAPTSWAGPVTAVLLCEGLLARETTLGCRVSTQFHGPGDVFAPWPDPDETLPCEIEWTAYEPTTVAVLDGHFAVGARRWPAIAAAVQRRMCAGMNRASLHVAIAQLPSVEQRILAVLWHLAQRFGRVVPDGVVLQLALTHQTIGRLVGAQRPTVSLAAAMLAEEGELTRCYDRTWLLSHGSRARLEPDMTPDGRSA